MNISNKALAAFGTPWRSPKLTVYGGMGQVTTAGSGKMTEGPGNTSTMNQRA
jgi:hypothetical protein